MTSLSDSGPTLDQRALVVVANRSPLVQDNRGWRLAAGGLVPIVKGVLERHGGTWVGWDGAARDQHPDGAGLGFEVRMIPLARRQREAYYEGYANRTLWPLLHEAVSPPLFDPSWWAAYEQVNATFAEAALEAALGATPALTWVHDYHLALVPGLLRELGAMNPVAFSLHTPFPSPSLFARLPHRSPILDGIGGADLVTFHTEGDRQRFEAAWKAYASGPLPASLAVAASIDVDSLASQARHPAVQEGAAELRRRLADHVVLLGVDRLDYSKGILERLRAVEVLMERRRDLRPRITYIQIASPSRESVPEYRQLRSRVEREIGRLNGRFTVPGGEPPFVYLHRRVSARQLLVHFLVADVALVTPLRDGMNLVAKEFVVAQHAVGGSGALVLSEFAGAAEELTDAMSCNPFDVEGTSAAIEAAIDEDEDKRRRRLASMSAAVHRHDLDTWAETILRQTHGAWRRTRG